MVIDIEKEIDLIRQCLREDYDRQKKYVDAKKVDREYMVGDRVFLRVCLYKSLIYSRKGSKMAPHFVGPFEILERIGPIAYYLALPPNLLCIHDMFHVLVLRKYIYDESHIIDWGALQVKLYGHIALEPICILG